MQSDEQTTVAVRRLSGPRTASSPMAMPLGSSIIFLPPLKIVTPPERMMYISAPRSSSWMRVCPGYPSRGSEFLCSDSMTASSRPRKHSRAVKDATSSTSMETLSASLSAARGLGTPCFCTAWLYPSCVSTSTVVTSSATAVTPLCHQQPKMPGSPTTPPGVTKLVSTLPPRSTVHLSFPMYTKASQSPLWWESQTCCPIWNSAGKRLSRMAVRKDSVVSLNTRDLPIRPRTSVRVF